ncbi:hypothetical protein [Nocardia higoensis]|uniref:hypothetical protein n=1 Tax=Nocardia higoensis TaxID=228599 RepID=UPI0002DC915E|nr:hypothetical protein [Nocardia higoensis]
MTAVFRTHTSRPPILDIDLGQLRMPWPTAEFIRCEVPYIDPTQPYPAAPDGDEAALAWYRWLLGHHLSFCVWRLMIEALGDAADGEQEAERELAELYDSYSALLLYAGTCSPEIYDTVLRARMKAADPAMSGTWARDYREIGARFAKLDVDAASPLKASLKLNRLVHMSVGARLVPTGKSLLRETGRDVRAEPTRAESDVVDAFFLTDRTELCAHEFRAQLRIRVRAALDDLAAHPSEISYGRAQVDALQTQLAEHIHAVARLADTILRRGRIHLG